MNMRFLGVCLLWWVLPAERLLKGSERVLALSSSLKGRLRGGAQLLLNRKGRLRGGDLGPRRGLDSAYRCRNSSSNSSTTWPVNLERRLR